MRQEFIIPGEPKGKSRPRVVNRNGHSMAFTPKDTVLYENMVKWVYTEKCGHRFPDDAALRVKIIAFYKIPKSVSKKKHREMIEQTILPTKKPDADNIAKIICDSLNGVAYRDDAQVVECRINKVYSDDPKVYVEIEEV